MKIQYMSDLHLEFGHLYLPEPAAEVLILAGDILTAHGFVNVKSKRDRYRKFLEHVSSNFDHVLYVGGNHELYGWKNVNKPYLDTIKDELPHNVHLLDNSTVTVGGLRFAGATLWTDFAKSRSHQDYASQIMNDYRVFSTNHTLAWHNKSVDFLKNTLKDGVTTVVVTHHAPSYLSVHPKYAGDMLNCAYASNLEYLFMDNVPFWVHGHMHNTVNYKVGNTRVLANPRGYPTNAGAENPTFNETATFEVHDGTTSKTVYGSLRATTE